MHLAVWTPKHTQAVLAGGDVLLAGAPGSGKSHLLREVLVPALLGTGAHVLIIDHADVFGAKIVAPAGTPLRRVVLGAATFGVAAANAPSPAPDLLRASCVVTLDCPRLERDRMCDLLLQSLYAELTRNPLPAGPRRVLILDIPHVTPAIPTFALMLRDARKFGFDLIVTCQSPSSLDDAVFGRFATRICFYHFFKRCLRRMAQGLLAGTGQDTAPTSEKPAPLNMYGQPVATPASRLAGELAQLKVGECLLGLPGHKVEKLKANPWG